MSKSTACESSHSRIDHAPLGAPAAGRDHRIAEVPRPIRLGAMDHGHQSVLGLGRAYGAARKVGAGALLGAGARGRPPGAGAPSPAGCTYTPSDLVDRGNGTIVCDLNATPLPSFPYHDVVVLGGVLEYVHDLPRLVRHLAGCCREIVASYAVTDVAGQAGRLIRRQHGWVNDLDACQVEALFRNHGFRRAEVLEWKGQRLFRFVQAAENDAQPPADGEP